MYKLGVVAFYSGQEAVANRSLWVPGWSGLILFVKKKSIFVLKIKRGSLYFKILDNVYMKEYRKMHKFICIAYWKKQAGVGKNNFFIYLYWPVRMIFYKFNKVKMYYWNKKKETTKKNKTKNQAHRCLLAALSTGTCSYAKCLLWHLKSWQPSPENMAHLASAAASGTKQGLGLSAQRQILICINMWHKVIQWVRYLTLADEVN